MPLEKSFLDLVNEYIPEEKPADQIAYESAQQKNTADLIRHFEELRAEAVEQPLIDYYSRIIDGHKKVRDVPVKTYTKEEMFAVMNSLKACSDFNILPVPISYLESLEDDNARDELDRIKLMKKQLTSSPEKRLENYKDYLLEKIDKKKLDRKLKSK